MLNFSPHFHLLLAPFSLEFYSTAGSVKLWVSFFWSQRRHFIFPTKIFCPRVFKFSPETADRWRRPLHGEEIQTQARPSIPLIHQYSPGQTLPQPFWLLLSIFSIGSFQAFGVYSFNCDFHFWQPGLLFLFVRSRRRSRVGPDERHAAEERTASLLSTGDFH